MAENIAVLGTGAIGTAVTGRLLDAGRDVAIWNRTPERLTGLTEAGARPAPSAAAAASSSELVLLTLTDYQAVGDVLATLPPDLDGHTVIALCTGTPAEALQAAEVVTGLGARYLDAGVQAAPEAIRTGAATLLYGGDRATFDRHLDTLRLLGPPRFVGDSPAAAAIWDLALFGVWYDAQLGLLRALDTVRTAGIDVTDFADTAATQLGHVVDATSATAAELVRGDFPRGPADLGEHLTVLRHLIELRAGGPIGDGGLAAVAARIEALTAQGRSTDGLTAVIA
ncbi:NAD(P)-binding domain-containing protein [Actinoplanes aureus]|uniref:NAD(P)-dependent oxidoreductase n=1 Tax=Actinoplanes aureus TaxID=2792083 RepID=A0A931C357_9ACTN|nr:NAD(P)-binding domain-containing protein [Actinoplanes aureus]MBG0562520.1 NAD(P)-dependent oxidoreductase [Actinoplanes aureus]